MLRNVLKIRIEDRVKIREIQKTTGAKYLGWRVEKSKLSFAGHMMRGGDKWGRYQRSGRRGSGKERGVDHLLVRGMK